MSDLFRVCPYKKYLQIRDGGSGLEPIELKTVAVTLTASTSNIVVVTAVTGKKIRVMGFYCQTNGAANAAISIKDGSGGTAYESFIAPQNTGLPFVLPVKDSGYWSTTTGNGVYADNGTATAGILVLRYVEYTPD